MRCGPERACFPAWFDVAGNAAGTQPGRRETLELLTTLDCSRSVRHSQARQRDS